MMRVDDPKQEENPKNSTKNGRHFPTATVRGNSPGHPIHYFYPLSSAAKSGRVGQRPPHISSGRESEKHREDDPAVLLIGEHPGQSRLYAMEKKYSAILSNFISR